MDIVKIASKLPSYAAYIKTRLISAFANLPEDLEGVRLHGVALTAAYFLKNEQLLNGIRAEAKMYLDADEANACKMAVVVLALASTYCSCEADHRGFPQCSALECLELESHEVSNVDFAFYCLTAAVMYGCSICITHYSEKLRASDVGELAIHRVMLLASLFKAAGEALDIEGVRSYEFGARQPSME